jgi:hypothetical protein
MQLEMIECPKCGNDFPLKRKELGYHVCVNCSTAKPVVGITTIEGTGDHTWNDLIIMDQDRAFAIAAREAELTGRKVDLEILNFDVDESEISQSVKEKLESVLHDNEDDDEAFPDPNNNQKYEEIEGIDY